MEKLKRSFYQRDTLLVAKELLGNNIVRNSLDGRTVGKIVETEAYIGPEDPASHAYRNLLTPRTRVQFSEGGYAYVYKIYGIYFCFNIVTEGIGKPAVVLIRSLEPSEGLQIMLKRRKKKNMNKINLCNGPGKLCISMDITNHLNGEDLLGDTLYLCKKEEKIPDGEIISTKRINIDYAGEAKNYLWRFIIRDNEFVSRN